MILHEERMNGVDIRVVACIESLAEKVKKRMGRDMIITPSVRTNEQQTALYNQPTDGIDNDHDGKIDEADECVTHAKAGQSAHNFYCAVDCWCMDETGKKIDWNNTEYKNICREHAMGVSDKIVWGGSFSKLLDMPHWELKSWRNVRSGVEKIIPNTI